MRKGMVLVCAGVVMALQMGRSALHGEKTAVLPASVEDRVGYPDRYRSEFQVVRTVVRSNEWKKVTVYANREASRITALSQRPYPPGSVFVMESVEILKDDQGRPRVEASGALMTGKVLGLHVMRKEEGYGMGYGSNKTGDWEYVEYRDDGSYITPPVQSGGCAACHVRAGAERDFVYRGRF